MPFSSLLADFARIRLQSTALCEPLEPEDLVVQSMPDASPAKWHLAHTTWFFETFVLNELPDYRSPHPEYRDLFNSYYNAVGEQFPRDRRGVLSRPTVAQISAYRQKIDADVTERLARGRFSEELLVRLRLGLQHEQQHQELLLTDIQHAFAQHPLRPTYWPAGPSGATERSKSVHFLSYDGGLVSIGHETPAFSFDNETPRHRVHLEPFSLASRPVTNGEYLEFVNDGGYGKPELWLSDGWAHVQQEKWKAPLYWIEDGEQWNEFSLRGTGPLELDAPVRHVSYFEADAFATWAGARLPTEAEWEHAVDTSSASPSLWGTLLEDREFRPRPVHGEGLAGVFGDVWEWTRSSYAPYPGFHPTPGALGEYNGKFMCSQMVLRGASCATPKSHVRATYRNFFGPEKRWQFSGIRLAKDVQK